MDAASGGELAPYCSEPWTSLRQRAAGASDERMAWNVLDIARPSFTTHRNHGCEEQEMQSSLADAAKARGQVERLREVWEAQDLGKSRLLSSLLAFSLPNHSKLSALRRSSCNLELAVSVDLIRISVKSLKLLASPFKGLTPRASFVLRSAHSWKQSSQTPSRPWPTEQCPFCAAV